MNTNSKGRGAMLGVLTILLMLWPMVIIWAQPKLIVGIVVDQMRYDYLVRFKDKFGKGGFNRLVNQGINFSDAHHDYIPTFTGPGHATIYSGSRPCVHGIVGNDWIDSKNRKRIYCVADPTVQTVGATGSAGKMSPMNLKVNVFADQLYKKSGGKAKIVALSLKDRGAVLAAGKTGGKAYWYESNSGDWISSSYYMNQLPKWVNEFNDRDLPQKYLQQDWTLLNHISTYEFGSRDSSDCETPFSGTKVTSFPYKLKELQKKGYDPGLLKSTPFGNAFTLEFAKEAVQKESLGLDAVCDFLSISLSSTDYIGHQFGPASVEIEDTYLRLDRDLESFLKFLDEKVGKQNIILFLTADHGAAEAANCAIKNGLDAGVLEEKVLADSLRAFYSREYKDTFLLVINEFDIYLRKDRIIRKGLTVSEVSRSTAKYLERLPGIFKVFTAEEIKYFQHHDSLMLEQQYKKALQRVTHVKDSLQQEVDSVYGDNADLVQVRADKKLYTSWPFNDSLYKKILGGYLEGLSGDMIMIAKPNWFPDFKTGTTHGSPYEYDTHVPLIFWGLNIQAYQDVRTVSVSQIASTILLCISVPSSASMNERWLFSPFFDHVVEPAEE